MLKSQVIDFELYAVESVRKALFDLESLADCATSIFRGVYPVESAYFIWGNLLSLPWMESYWQSEAGCDMIKPVPIEDEIAKILTSLESVHGYAGISVNPANTYLSLDLCSDEKMRVQSLAVETLLSIDEALHCLISHQPEAALPWVSSAYKFEMEVMHYAWRIADKSDESRKAAAVRHAGSRMAKQKVFTWCDENMHRFTSMDDAAGDIAETFVPQKFRAVREWMTEWKKLRSAGRP